MKSGEIGGLLWAGSQLPGGSPFSPGKTPGDWLPAPSSVFAARGRTSARPHPDWTGVWPASGVHTGEAEHNCRERMSVPGGARNSKGPFVLQRSLSRWRRMRSTTRGSIMQEKICGGSQSGPECFLLGLGSDSVRCRKVDIPDLTPFFTVLRYNSHGVLTKWLPSTWKLVLLVPA